MKLQPAMIFGAHMVLQRRQPVVVWGKAAAGDTVRVTLGADTASAPVEKGHWQVTLPAREAETGLTMTICAEQTGECITLPDVAVGEVWLAGGQSNMEFLMKYDVEAPALIPAADDPLLRCFDYPELTSALQRDLGRYETAGFWRRWTPEDAPWFTAVGYYFAAQLRQVLQIPVGIVSCNYGGTVASTWTSRETLAATPALQPVLDSYQEQQATLDWPAYFAAHRQQVSADPAVAGMFMDHMLMGGSMAELMEKLRAVLPIGEDGAFTPPVPMMGPVSQNAPGVLYDNMLTRVAPYGIQGVIWYQGESDEDTGWAEFYAQSLKAMRADWCRLWGRELPLLQVMLAPFDRWLQVQAREYPLLRQQQKLLADTEPGFYCANIMDHGEADNIHPREKRYAGERLALLARRHIYGEDVAADSPTLRAAQWQDGRVVCSFDHAEGGLHLTGETVSALTLLVDGQPVPAQATVEGDQLVVTAEGLTDGASAELRYAWENYCLVNCYNAAGLPVFPFIAVRP